MDNHEEIIKDEARKFHHDYIRGGASVEAIDDFRLIKNRLLDFYPPEDKALFLDEMSICIKDELQKHRNKVHGGKAGTDCKHEIKPIKLLFYIKQEMETLPLVAHQKQPYVNTGNRTKVFISYSHADKDFLNDIKRHFKPFKEQIDFWDDSNITPGSKWKDEIEKAIQQTKVAILLVSTDFLGSDFITTSEIPPLLKIAEEEGGAVLTVILKPCLFEEFGNLNQYQALNAPSNPVSKMDENEREELYVNLVRQTKKILEKS